jgi:hypothetical protein
MMPDLNERRWHGVGRRYIREILVEKVILQTTKRKRRLVILGGFRTAVYFLVSLDGFKAPWKILGLMV